MVVQCLLFLLGLGLLLLSTGFLVKASEQLALKLKLSPLIIGITIVAIGTSLPELVVSSLAAFQHDYGLALGNIVGSSIGNILFILPVGIVIGKLRIGTTKTQRVIWLLLAVTCLYTLIHVFYTPTPLAVVSLLGMSILVTYLIYRWGKEGSTHEDVKNLAKLAHQEKAGNFTMLTALGMLVSLALIVIGGLLLVKATEEIALLLGYSTTVLGLSLTAIATSLPELFTTIFSQEEHDDKLTLGNILGSNIYNIALTGALAAVYMRNVTFPITNWFWLVGSTALLLGMVKTYRGKSVPKWLGYVLFALFLVYIATLSS